jgi:hypothetical protein
MSEYASHLFSSTQNEFHVALNRSVHDILDDDAEIASVAMENMDEYGYDQIRDESLKNDKPENLRRLGLCWAVAAWLSIGLVLPEFEDLIKDVAKEVTNSQRGFISSTKSVIGFCGHDFHGKLRDRSVSLRVIPTKNLAEKLAAILKHRNIVSGLTNTSYDPNDFESILDEFACDLLNWLEARFDGEEMRRCLVEERTLKTTDLDAFLYHIRPLSMNFPRDDRC